MNDDDRQPDQGQGPGHVPGEPGTADWSAQEPDADLQALLADADLWVEPPARLEDAVVAAISAEVAARASTQANSPTPLSTVSPPGPRRRPTVSSTGSSALEGPRSVTDLTDRRERQRPSRRLRPTWLLAAAAAVAAVALSAVLLLRAGPPQYDVALAATDLAPGATGTATMVKTDSGWRINLDATGLPRLDSGRYYQAWLRDGSGLLVPVGSFNEGADVTLWSGVSPADFSTLTITQESADGAQDSSGKKVLVGTAVKK